MGVLAIMAMVAVGATRQESALEAPREFRGAWIATVDNIDWPSKPGLPVAEQKKELLAILDRAAKMRLNALIFQVRPACDAMYRSSLEPWSYYLTGKQGQAPQPAWDPLEFAVREAHRRCIELHAWFNPYRAKHPSGKGPLASTHVSKVQLDWVRRYGKSLWLDPGNADAREHSLAVILDVLKRYDVDGVHIDDYFYPYPEGDPATKAEIPFPDDATWKDYQAGGGSLSKGDWRRDNVNLFVREIYERTKALKPWVKVGISPFGIYRPGEPPTVKAGFDQYTAICADPKLWLESGWCDYLAPQLYWRIQSAQSYPELLTWWHAHNPRGRYIWPGSFTSLVDPGNKDWPVAEIVHQVQASRHMAGGRGHIHFSSKVFMRDGKGLVSTLRDGPYAKPAVVPPLKWATGTSPGAPRLEVQNGLLAWSAPDETVVRFWTLYRQEAGKWEFVRLLPCETRAMKAPGPWDAAGVGVLDRRGVESPITTVRLSGSGQGSKLHP